MARRHRRTTALCLLACALPYTYGVCANDFVLLNFDQSSLVNDNFAGRDAASEAAGDPQTVRFGSVATVGGRTIDVVLDSPDGALPNICLDGNCDVLVNSYGVAAFKVANNASRSYRVRWNFVYTDTGGAATLPRTAVTWLDVGSGEVRIKSNRPYTPHN